MILEMRDILANYISTINEEMYLISSQGLQIALRYLLLAQKSGD